MPVYRRFLWLFFFFHCVGCLPAPPERDITFFKEGKISFRKVVRSQNTDKDYFEIKDEIKERFSKKMPFTIQGTLYTAESWTEEAPAIILMFNRKITHKICVFEKCPESNRFLDFALVDENQQLWLFELEAPFESLEFLNKKNITFIMNGYSFEIKDHTGLSLMYRSALYFQDKPEYFKGETEDLLEVARYLKNNISEFSGIKGLAFQGTPSMSDRGDHSTNFYYGLKLLAQESRKIEPYEVILLKDHVLMYSAAGRSPLNWGVRAFHHSPTFNASIRIFHKKLVSSHWLKKWEKAE